MIGQVSFRQDLEVASIPGLLLCARHGTFGRNLLPARLALDRQTVVLQNLAPSFLDFYWTTPILMDWTGTDGYTGAFF